MDARLGILITENYDAVNAAWDKHEQKITSGLKTLDAAHSKHFSDLTSQHGQYLKTYQTLEDAKVKYATKTSQQIKAAILAIEHEIKKEQDNIEKSKTANSKLRSATNIADYKSELANLKLISNEVRQQESLVKQASNAALKTGASEARNQKHQEALDQRAVKEAAQQAKSLQREQEHSAKVASIEQARNQKHSEATARLESADSNATKRREHEAKQAAALETQYEHVKTKKLVDDIFEIQKKKVVAVNAMKAAALEGAKEEVSAQKKVVESYDAQLRVLSKISISRKEVQHGGAGALIGQLGIGRGLTEIAHPLEGLSSMTGGMQAASVATASILAVVAAAELGKKVFEAWTESAKRFEESEDRIAVALTRTGLKGADLRQEIKFVSHDVDAMFKSFNGAIPRQELAETTASIAAFSRTGGKDLQNLTKLAVGVSTATGMELTQVAKLIGKVADPEITTNAAQRYGIVIDARMSQTERIKALNDQYGDSIAMVEERMKEGVHSWEGLKNRVQDAADKFALKEFKQLGPTFEELTPKVEGFVENLSEIKLQPAIDRLTKIYHVFQDIGTMFKMGMDIGMGGGMSAGQMGESFGGGASVAEKILDEEHKRLSAAADKIEAEESARVAKRIKAPAIAAAKAEREKELKNEASIRREIEDREAALIKGKEARELEQERLRYKREVERITAEVKNTKERDILSELLEKEHGDKLIAIHKDVADALEKKEDEAWGGHMERLQKRFVEEEKAEQHAAESRDKLRVKLEDRTDDAIANKFKKEAAQEQRQYEREQKRILAQADGTKETHALINAELEQLDKDHADKLTKITGDSEVERTKKLSESWKELNAELSKGTLSLNDILKALTEATLKRGMQTLIDLISGVNSTKGAKPQIPTAIQDVGSIDFNGPANITISGEKMPATSGPGTSKIGDIPSFEEAMGLKPNMSRINIGSGPNGLDDLFKYITPDNLPNIPGYETGTAGAIGGLSRLGERGVELAITPSGQLIPVGLNGEELRVIPKGTTVIPHENLSSFIVDSLKNKPIAFDKSKTDSSQGSASVSIREINAKHDKAVSHAQEVKERVDQYYAEIKSGKRKRSTGALGEAGLLDPIEYIGPGAGGAIGAIGHGAAAMLKHGVIHAVKEVAEEKLLHTAFESARNQFTREEEIPAYADGTPDFLSTLAPFLKNADGPLSSIVAGFGGNVFEGLTHNVPTQHGSVDRPHSQRKSTFGEVLNSALFATIPAALSAVNPLSKVTGALSNMAQRPPAIHPPSLSATSTKDNALLSDILGAIRGQPRDVLTLGPGFEDTRGQALALETYRSQ